MKKNWLFDPPPPQIILKTFCFKNIDMGTKTNHLDKLKTFFDMKNSSEIVPYPNKEHYSPTVYITQWLALFGYGTISDDFFYIKKRFQLVKKIRLSTHIDIFEEKIFSKIFFGVGGQKVKFFFQFYDVKSTEIFISNIQIVAKCLFRGVLTNFIKKVPFWGPYIPFFCFTYL